MKLIQQQERTRRGYHDDAASNTVHRTSLLAPRLPGTGTEISFINHFLLKRGYDDVACRLTAIDQEGSRIESRTWRIAEPRVYVFELDQLAVDGVGNYLIEFFSAENFFYPFPAVVINHRSEGSLNSVHSYNRILNDVFEDDEVNSATVAETSIDTRVDSSTDTFGVFTSGPIPCTDPIRVTLDWSDNSLEASVSPSGGRLSNTIISVRDLFGAEAERPGGVLRFAQPPQSMFYGRMLAGLRSTMDGATAANHSFYDCSAVSEYWPDGRASSRVYPLFDGFAARIRLYPIFSPCRANARIELRGESGRILRTVECEPLDSPSGRLLDVAVSELASDLSEARSFSFSVWASHGATPRRINHQLIYEDTANPNALPASVAISLKNPNAFRPPNARGLCWGQCATGTDLESRIGLVLDEADDAAATIDLRLYSEDGEVYRRELSIKGGGVVNIDPAVVLPESNDKPVRYLWYWATSTRPDLAAYCVSKHRSTGHCTGEHSF